SMMSLMPRGMPSIVDNGRPSRQRAADRSAAARAEATSRQTKAPTVGSHDPRRARQRSRNSRGVSLPAAKSAEAGKKGAGRGWVIDLRLLREVMLDDLPAGCAPHPRVRAD